MTVPGTLPVALIAGLGLASSLALKEHAQRMERCAAIEDALRALEPLGTVPNGDAESTAAHTLNFSLPSVDSEAAIVALKDLVAISNGSACISQSYEPPQGRDQTPNPFSPSQTRTVTVWRVVSGFDEDEVFGRVGELNGLAGDGGDGVQAGGVGFGDDEEPVVACGEEGGKAIE